MPQGLAGRVSRCSAPTSSARSRKVIAQGKSRIEVARWILGDVKPGERRKPICELELELLSGETADVLTLAKRRAGNRPAAPGSLSKAARGYHLAQGNEDRVHRDR
ncbi:hypothetical protein ACNKHQ_17735 [Shigella flexneri]